MKKIIDYKSVEITEEEYKYYLELLKEFSNSSYDAKEQVKGLFNVDEDGCITSVTPPLNKPIIWGILFFFQTLMLNQRIRRIERKMGLLDE